MDPTDEQVQTDIEQCEEEHKFFCLGEMEAFLASYMSGMYCLPGTDHSVQQAVLEVTEKLKTAMVDACSTHGLAVGLKDTRR